MPFPDPRRPARSTMSSWSPTPGAGPVPWVSGPVRPAIARLEMRTSPGGGGVERNRPGDCYLSTEITRRADVVRERSTRTVGGRGFGRASG